jgi:flagellar hook-associated protein 1 FlgK
LQSSFAIADSRGNIGTGVEQETIDRISDEFIMRRIVQESASEGSLDAQANALSQVENILNEQGGEGLTTQLSEFFNAWEDLASAGEANQPTERAAVIAQGQLFVETVHRIDLSLRDLQQSLDRSIVGLLPEVNSIIDRIASLNDEIVKLEVTAPANDLRDQREQALRDLSNKVEVTWIENSNGSLTVFFEGGVPLVEGSRTAHLVPVADPTNSFDPTFSSVYYDDGSNFFDVSARMGGGELGGLLRSRDTHVAGAIRDLDATIYTLLTSVNTQHQAGFGLDGNTGRDFFLDPGVLDNAARDFDLDAALVANPDIIAAAQGGGTAAELAGDTENAKAISALRDTVAVSYQAGDVAGTPTGSSQTIMDQAAGLIAEQGQTARSLQSALDQQQRVLLEIENRRDEISGVSLDEEMTDLIRLQAAFQANSRVIAAVDRMLQELVSVV